ncbi:hypothetical protein [Chroococcidiopsis sp.]|uniref:hypothetical protein n=1 Tax=Chroococcidiopsis sp. TaxID=3088168 RepID=UPI003F34EE40
MDKASQQTNELAHSRGLLMKKDWLQFAAETVLPIAFPISNSLHLTKGTSIRAS